MGKRTVIVNDKMQQGYRYRITEPAGRNFDPEFRPQLKPKEMLALGVFCGKYMTDSSGEFPRSWFAAAKLADGRRDCSPSASMPASRSRSGAIRGGFIPTTRAAGSSGIVVITWVAVCPTRIAGRLSDGRRCSAMSARSSGTASPAISCVANVSDRRCCTGPTTAERFDAGDRVPKPSATLPHRIVGGT
jgi:hypothetical protein